MLACTQLFSHSSHRGRSQWTCKSRHCRSRLRVRYPSQKMHSIRKRPTEQAAAFLPFKNPPENHLATLGKGENKQKIRKSKQVWSAHFLHSNMERFYTSIVLEPDCPSAHTSKKIIVICLSINTSIYLFIYLSMDRWIDG